MKRKTKSEKRKTNVDSGSQILKQKSRCGKTILAITLIILLSGCASLKEAFKGFAGISTKELEINRKSAITKTFDFDYFTAFTKALDALRDMETFIYAKDINKHMIAIYVSRQDTTPVGIFFTEVNSSATQLEVSSPSKFSKEYISERLFKALKQTPQTTKGKKGDINAEK